MKGLYRITGICQARYRLRTMLDVMKNLLPVLRNCERAEDMIR